jgi:biopolymer transport protein ExbD
MAIKTNVKIISGPVPLAPLVDVVFLLLIFFMISSSLVFWPGLRVDTKVQLPASRTNSMRAADKLVITMTRSELYFFNDKPVGWDDLERQLKEAVLSSRIATGKRRGSKDDGAAEPYRSPLVVLRADKSIPYGKIVDVMSLARSLNLGVYLVTDSQGNDRRTDMRSIGE